MKSPARTPLGAIFRTEVLLNSKRVAPYAMVALFGGNALLWWGWGPATGRGWATNSEFFIASALPVYSFMTLPLFTAVIMGDPVIRDFRTGVAPLIFSKPVGRASYLLGKFFGNFFLLVCCQMAFPLTLFLLQWVSKSGMVVQPARAIPYFKHFFVLVVVSHLFLAALYFTVGTLTRSAKLVYGLAVSFYPVYIAYQTVLLKRLPQRWRIALDPLLMNWQANTRGRTDEWLNQLALSYDADVIANRALMLLASAACLAILYARFSKVERFKKYAGDDSHVTTINLAERADRLDAGAESYDFAPPAQTEEVSRREKVALPKVSVTTEGVGASLKQLEAAFVTELRLLLAERSLVVLAPLATLLCVVGLAYYEVAPEASYSAAYAGYTAETLLLFLCAVAVFYTGEAIHRDRELRFEPVLWGAPAPNFALLLSKFAATLLLSLSLTALVGASAVALQIYKGHTPIEISVYLTIYSVILVPSMIFLTAAAVAFNVLLRDKYLAYALSIAVGVGLLYLFNQGANHWLYNPVLYGLWTPSAFEGASAKLPLILTHRVYCLALATLLLSLAHLFFERKSARRLGAGGARWAILIALLSTAAAVVTGLMINV